MDLRQVMRRLNDLTSELEEMLMAPVQLVEGIVEWVQKWIWDAYMADAPKGGGKKGKKKKKRKKGKRKRKKTEFRQKEV